MNKAFEKILERLEELQNYACFPTEWVNEEQSKIHSYYADKLTEILKLTKQYNNDWIPCSERLPESGVHVLCYGKNSLGSFKYEVSVYAEEIECWMCSKIADVIAWQPLPEPFKERD